MFEIVIEWICGERVVIYDKIGMEGGGIKGCEEKGDWM